ncbi:unnamed protein product [Coregonus sp. 'balchen']|nr:unnamed protein product [Coregonus sp. 'balchen']
MVDSMLSAEGTVLGQCQYCNSEDAVVEGSVLGLCQYCNSENAVVQCRDCLPRHLLCASCDIATHSTKVLHNRESLFEGFYLPLSPTTVIHQDDEGSLTFQEQVCVLPMAVPQLCGCAPSALTVMSGKQVILIGINGMCVVFKDITSIHMFLKNVINYFLIITPDSGRYNLSLPALNCSGCLRHWTVGLDELVKSGDWPATLTHQTIFTVDLF